METRPLLATAFVSLYFVLLVTALTTTEDPSTTTMKLSSTEKNIEKETTTTTTSTSASPTSTGVPPPATSTEWEDMSDDESQKLVNFVVDEIQKLKVEHRELDECQELNLSTVLSGKKMSGKVTKYTVTLKVQPQLKSTEGCLQQNTTTTNNNMHPEICEADVTDDDHGGTEGKTLLRSTCLQVEELQD